MTALTRILFPLPDYRRTPWSLLGWWESRRPTFNLFVGAAGLVTLGVVEFICWLPPGLPGPPHPLLGVLVYGLTANVCYSGGWLAELLMRAVWKDDAPPVGPALFRQGLSFAVGLTLLPIPVVCFGWLLRVLSRLL